jgi:hypothetical protein
MHRGVHTFFTMDGYTNTCITSYATYLASVANRVYGGLLDRGQWVTVAEAAQHLQITQDAVRQRVRRGTIEHSKDSEGRIIVYLTEQDIRRDTVRDELVEQLRSEIEYLRAENQRKDHLLAAALERVPPALEAPPDEGESPVRASGVEGGSGGPPELTEQPRRSSWWQRLLGG